MNTSENSTYMQSLDNFNEDNTIFTFSIGFGILLIIIIFGILGTAFLCLSLDKDPGNLWPVETSTQVKEDNGRTLKVEMDDQDFTVAEIV